MRLTYLLPRDCVPVRSSSIPLSALSIRKEVDKLSDVTADLSYLYRAARNLLPYAKFGHLHILRRIFCSSRLERSVFCPLKIILRCLCFRSLESKTNWTRTLSAGNIQVNCFLDPIINSLACMATCNNTKADIK